MSTEREIPVSQISDPEWNSRTSVDKDKLASLAETIKTRGLKQAITVEELTPTTFILVFGSRRLAATRLAGLETIRAVVRPATDKKTRILDNALENIQREDLTPYELARTCATLREQDLKLKEVQEATGLSVPYISNLVVCYTKLAPPVLVDWAANHEAAKLNFIRSLADKDHPEQIKEWNKHKALFEKLDDKLYPEAEPDISPEESPDDTDTDEEDDKPVIYKVEHERYAELIGALKAAKAPAIGLHVAQYLIGATDGIKGIIDPPKPAEKPAKAEKGKKTEGNA